MATPAKRSEARSPRRLRPVPDPVGIEARQQQRDLFALVLKTAVLPRPSTRLAANQGTGSVWREAAGGRPCRQRSAGGTW